MRVGILGGGQLARMLALAGHPLGVTCIFVDPSEHAPARVCATQLRAAYDDPGALEALAASCDVATYEFENVPDASARLLSAHVACHPGAHALATAQDRIAEKDLFRSLGLATPPYAAVDDSASLDAALTKIGYPCVLKTRRLGYDGKGQRVLRAGDDAQGAFSQLGNVPCILEGFVRFEREIAILAARNTRGEVVVYPPVETVQDHGLLVAARAPVASARKAEAEAAVRALLDALDYIGVLALETFETDRGLIANEMAPRVHNSGHWTIEGAATSQFENHLRAILGLPLGDVTVSQPVVLANLVGRTPPLDALLAIPGAHVHLYGKAPSPGRKLGHVTLVGAPDESLARLRALVGEYTEFAS